MMFSGGRKGALGTNRLKRPEDLWFIRVDVLLIVVATPQKSSNVSIILRMILNKKLSPAEIMSKYRNAATV